MVVSALGISLTEMAMLLPAPISLPPTVMNILNATGSDALQLTTSTSTTELLGDSGTLLALQYDDAALNRLVVVLSSLSDRIAFIQTLIDIPVAAQSAADSRRGVERTGCAGGAGCA